MHLFYTPDILPANTTYTLSEEESKHCIRVLRLNSGDTISLIDGKGGWYDATIAGTDAKRCVVNIVNTIKQVGKRNFKLHIAIAPTKNNDRTEWFIEKATEIGIDEISMIESKHTERSSIKTERFLKVAISAIKQSLKAYLPQLNNMLGFEKFITTSTDFKGQKFIAHCNKSVCGDEAEKKHLRYVYEKNKDVLILIGPEGDFTVEEVKLALNKGFQEISLGNSRLRTETAALYACMVIHVMNE